MYIKVSLSMFRDAMKETSFSYNGLEALYDYLEECGDFELDVVELRCGFVEYSSKEEVGAWEEVVIEFDGGVIVCV